MKEIVQNPISLTTNLLNIPIASKSRVIETSIEGKMTNENNKQNKIIESNKKIEEMENNRIINQKLNNDESKIISRDPRLAAKASQEIISPTKLDPNKNNVNNKEIEDECKFKFIKSEGGKELKLKNKPKIVKKIKNQLTPLVVIEKKIETPIRRSSISSESDQSSCSQTKTIEIKRKQEKCELILKKNKNDLKILKHDNKKIDISSENNTEKISKEKLSSDNKVNSKKIDIKEKSIKTPVKLLNIENSKETTQAYKPVRKLKVYGKNSQTTIKKKKLISDALPDTVPSEEIAKYYAMEIENYPNILQDLIEDPIDVCPAKEVFFGNMSLKEDDISDIKSTFDIEDEQKSKQLIIEDINPMENIFDNVVLEADLQETNIVYSDINSCVLSPKTDEIFDEQSVEKPELFHFGIDDSDTNLRLNDDLPPILTEREIDLPLSEVEKLNNKSLIEQLDESVSEQFLIKDNVRLEMPDTVFDKKEEPEESVKQLFDSEIVKNPIDSVFENVFDNNELKTPAIEVTPSIICHVTHSESRETGDLSHLLNESSHVDIVVTKEKSLSEIEFNSKIINQEEKKCVEYLVSDDKEKTMQIDDNNKDESQINSKSPVTISNDNENSQLPSEFILIENDLPLLAKKSNDSDDKLEIDSINNSTIEVKSNNKPKKLSEIVLQSGVMIVKDNYEQKIGNELLNDNNKCLVKSDLPSLVSEIILDEKEASVEENIVNQEKVENLADFEVRLNPSETETVHSKMEDKDELKSEKSLHKLKRRRRMKRKKDKKIKDEIKDAIKQSVKPVTTQSLVARMKEIDDEIQKLMLEKQKLYQMMADASTKDNNETNSLNLDIDKRSKISSPEDDEIASFEKELSTPIKESSIIKEKSSKIKKLSINSDDEEIGKISEKKTKKLTKTERSQSKLRKTTLTDSSSEDEEIKRITKEKQKKLTKGRHKKHINSDDDEEQENISLDRLKKLAERSQSRMKKNVTIEAENEEIDKREKKEEIKISKRPKSVMKVTKKSSSEDDNEKKNKKIQRRPKSAMKLFSEKFSDDDDKKLKKKFDITKRPKSAMKITSKVTESSEVTSGDEEVAMLNLNNKKPSLKNTIDTQRIRPKSAMKPTISKLIPSSGDDDDLKKREEKMKITKKIEISRKRPKSVMMKSSKSDNNDDDDEEQEIAVKKKKIKELPSLNTSEKIFVKIKGKHERDKFKKKDSPEKKVQIVENKNDEEKLNKKLIKGASTAALINRFEAATKKKIETSPKSDKSKKVPSPRKEKKDNEFLDKKHVKVKAIDTALIYSDESILEPLESSKDKTKKNNTALGLLEQSFKREMAEAKKAKAVEKKKKMQENEIISKDEKEESKEQCFNENEKIDTKLEPPSLPISQENEISKNLLISEINEEECRLNEEVQRINSTLDKSVDDIQNNLIENNQKAQETIIEEKNQLTSPTDSEQQIFSHPNFKEFSDKDSTRSALMSPISDDSSISIDSTRKRKRPTRSLSRAGRTSQPTRRSSRHLESEDERSRTCGNSIANTPEPPQKKKKVNEKILYSTIRDLIKLELRTKRKDRKKRKLTQDEMENCKVKLVDIKYTYMKDDLPNGVLKRLGLTKINVFNKNPLENSILLHQEIMNMQQVRRFSIDENFITDSGSKNSETTMYILKPYSGKKLEIVKINPENNLTNQEVPIEEMKSKIAEIEKEAKAKKEIEKEKEQEEKNNINLKKNEEKEKNEETKEVEKNDLPKGKQEETEKEINKETGEKEIIESVKEINEPTKEIEESAKGIINIKELSKETNELEKEEKTISITKKNNKSEKEKDSDNLNTQQNFDNNELTLTNGPNVSEENKIQSQQNMEVDNTDVGEISKIQYTVHKGPILDIKVRSQKRRKRRTRK